MLKQDKPTLEQLDNELKQASKILDNCAYLIRNIPLEPTSTNIKNIGYALSYIFDIQNEIYKLKPELTPQYLLDKKPKKGE